METSLTRLRHIVAVDRTASFSLAAEEEGITQPALSRSIQAFEQQHGVRLFDRGRGGVSPTPAGTLVVEQARGMLAAAGELERSLRLYGKGEAGRVGVGFGPLMGSLLVPALGKTLLRSRPNLQLVAMVRPPDQLLEKLADGSIEMIVGNNWQLSNAPGVVQENIIDLSLSMVVRGGHPLARMHGLKMADLDGYPAATAVELPRPGMHAGGGLVSDSYHILRDVTADTDCVWITSLAFVTEELRTGRLVQLDVADLSTAQTEICLVYQRGHTRSPAALAVADEVRRLLRAMAG
jgi:LysR family transcriptional regulator, pca operon transcriptional activator